MGIACEASWGGGWRRGEDGGVVGCEGVMGVGRMEIGRIRGGGEDGRKGRMEGLLDVRG